MSRLLLLLLLASWRSMVLPMDAAHPAALERTRATGRADYLLALGLSERQLYADALIIRLAGSMRAWARGESPPSHAYLSPLRLMRIFGAVRRQVVAEGCEAINTPFPADVWRTLMRYRAMDPHAALAAEDGRGAA